MTRPNQWCSNTTKLQDQDHLFFQDQDRLGQDRLGQDQDQDHFFKTKAAFFKDHQIINPRHWRSQKFERESNWKNYCNVTLVRFFGDAVVMTSLKWRHNYGIFWSFDFVIFSFKNTITELQVTNIAIFENLLILDQGRNQGGAKGAEAPPP